MKIDLTNIDQIDFDKSALIPAIVQDSFSGVILMQGFMNKDALAKTLETTLVTFYSRSKERLWTKGESSRNVLNLDSIYTDCDRDSLLILANPQGPTCHLGTNSCFDVAAPQLAFLDKLNKVIAMLEKGSIFAPANG